MKVPTVELLWWSGCPSHPRAKAMLEEAMTVAGIPLSELQSVQMVTQEDAVREHFVGSPTIRVNGADISPPDASEPAALTCRLYFSKTGRPSSLPDAQIITEAVMAIAP